tara:strand:+ start:1159 stop:1665 length:507 start_codon:yes stop_codon:yes gene_type:complete
MKVRAFGFRNTIAVLKELDDEAGKIAVEEIRKEAIALRDEARDLVDPQGLSKWGNWRGGYDAARVRGGIKVTKAKSRRRGRVSNNFMGVWNTTPAGVIWELAGRVTPPSTSVFVRNVQNRSGRPASRLLYAAFDSSEKFDKEDAFKNISQAVEKAQRQAQARMGALGG